MWCHVQCPSPVWRAGNYSYSRLSPRCRWHWQSCNPESAALISQKCYPCHPVNFKWMSVISLNQANAVRSHLLVKKNSLLNQKNVRKIKQLGFRPRLSDRCILGIKSQIWHISVQGMKFPCRTCWEEEWGCFLLLMSYISVQKNSEDQR